MELFCKKLILSNWMGGTLSAELSAVTDVFGYNGTGKSRLKDAYHWLVTGKNAVGETQFNIKDELDKDKHRLEMSVEGVFLKDGDEINLKKIFYERWGTEKQEEEEKLLGNSIKYFINGNKKTKGEFEELVNAMINDKMLKLLSDPLYFPGLHWTEQRQVLEHMAKDITPEFVIDEISTVKKKYLHVVALLNRKDSIEDRLKRVKFEISEAKKEKDLIQPKIDENNVSIKAYGTLDADAANKEIERLQGLIDGIDSSINSKSEAGETADQELRKKRTQRSELNDRQAEIETEVKIAYNKAKTDATAGKSELEQNVYSKTSTLQTAKNGLSTFENDLKELENQLNTINENIKSLVAEFTAEGKKLMPVIDESGYKCTECGTAWDAEKIATKKDKIKEDFVNNKKARLVSLNTRGQSLEIKKGDKLKDIEAKKTEIETQKALITEKETDLTTVETELKALNDKIAASEEIKSFEDRIKEHTEYQDNVKKIAALTTLINADKTEIDYGTLKTDKANYNLQMDAQKNILNNVEAVNKLTERNKAHAENQKKLAQQIATLQKEQAEIDDFVIGRMNLIEKRIRSKFDNVRFKMFETKIGDGEDKPACEIIYDGIPYPALNTARKLNAGLDIINGLSRHYGIKVPIFIDERESVIKVIPVDSQIVNFFVSEDHKELTIINK